MEHQAAEGWELPDEDTRRTRRARPATNESFASQIAVCLGLRFVDSCTPRLSAWVDEDAVGRGSDSRWMLGDFQPQHRRCWAPRLGSTLRRAPHSSRAL